jgi:hypothetical protein
MIFYYRKGQYRTVSLFAARSSITLWLIVSERRAEAPRVVQGPFSDAYSLGEQEVRAVVMAGMAEANAEYGTLLFPTEIKVTSEGGNDLLQRAAFLVVERLATRGDAGFELLDG